MEIACHLYGMVAYLFGCLCITAGTLSQHYVFHTSLLILAYLFLNLNFMHENEQYWFTHNWKGIPVVGM